MAHQAGTNGVLTSVLKPAILCLHGGGTNTGIFNIQTIRIQRALASDFDFVFLDAPIESGPGPDVLPVFEGCGPYLRWTIDRASTEMPEVTKTMIDRLAGEQRAKDGRGFVGILGFSQGAKLATGLLLEHQLEKGIDWGDGLRFGVICNGTSPPLTYHLSQEERSVKLDIPTLHLVGLLDPWRDESRRLRSVHCQHEQAVLLEFDVGHRLPFLPQDNVKICAEILRMYHESSARNKLALGASP
jgi:predicted esterase